MNFRPDAVFVRVKERVSGQTQQWTCLVANIDVNRIPVVIDRIVGSRGTAIALSRAPRRVEAEIQITLISSARPYVARDYIKIRAILQATSQLEPLSVILRDLTHPSPGIGDHVEGLDRQCLVS